SRVIVVDPQGEDGPAITQFTHRLVEATRALVVSDPINPGADMGPVIDPEALAKIHSYIELGKKECKLELGETLPPGLHDKLAAVDAARGGAAAQALRSFVPPHIFSHVKPTHAIARDEIFGPVLAVMHASSFEDALAL